MLILDLGECSHSTFVRSFYTSADLKTQFAGKKESGLRNRSVVLANLHAYK